MAVAVVDVLEPVEVGDAERLAEAGDDVAQPSALVLELVEPRLQLRGHLVERAAEQGELVPALNGHPLLQVAASDRACGVYETADRTDDRAALDVCHRRDQQETRDEPDEQASHGGVVRGVDEALRADHPYGHDGLSGRRL